MEEAPLMVSWCEGQPGQEIDTFPLVPWLLSLAVSSHELTRVTWMLTILLCSFFFRRAFFVRVTWEESIIFDNCYRKKSRDEGNIHHLEILRFQALGFLLPQTFRNFGRLKKEIYIYIYIYIHIYKILFFQGKNGPHQWVPNQFLEGNCFDMV